MRERPERPEIQDWLIPYENPLTRRIGAEFFKKVPRAPGIYFMLGRDEAILYVGKAKNLRARLNSYRRARPDQVSRKVVRLIHVVDRIRWETCVSEKAALLRENSLLRAHKPPFNVVNTHPESYYLVAFTRGAAHLRFALTTAPEPPGSDGEFKLFGAFKGRGTIRDGYAALLRLLWLTCSGGEPGDLPSVLSRYRPAYRYDLRLAERLSEKESAEWSRLIESFLSGRSRRLLPKLTGRLLEREEIHPFLYHSIQEDLERLQEFYQRGPRRNHRICRALGLERSQIAQVELDDLLVHYRDAERNARCSKMDLMSPNTARGGEDIVEKKSDRASRPNGSGDRDGRAPLETETGPSGSGTTNAANGSTAVNPPEKQNSTKSSAV